MNLVTIPPVITNEITATLTLVCTTVLESVVQVHEGERVATIPFFAESKLSCFLSIRDLHVGKLIGKGAYGRVFRGKYRSENVAVKKIQMSLQDTKEYENIKKELDLMSRFRSAYIVTFMGTASKGKATYIVMELCKLGTLTSHFKTGELTVPLKFSIALDIAMGMRYLHANRILHRDLKSDNILLVSLSTDAQVRAKISDFGTSRIIANEMKQQMTQNIGTPIFVAPEVLKNQQYSTPCDVYSFAVLLLTIWNEEYPYSDMPDQYSIFAYILSGSRPPVPANCAFKSIIENSWQQDPDARLSFSEIVAQLGDLMRHGEDASASDSSSEDGELGDEEDSSSEEGSGSSDDEDYDSLPPPAYESNTCISVNEEDVPPPPPDGFGAKPNSTPAPPFQDKKDEPPPPFSESIPMQEPPPPPFVADLAPPSPCEENKPVVLPMPPVSENPEIKPVVISGLQPPQYNDHKPVVLPMPPASENPGIRPVVISAPQPPQRVQIKPSIPSTPASPRTPTGTTPTPPSECATLAPPPEGTSTASKQTFLSCIERKVTVKPARMSLPQQSDKKAPFVLPPSGLERKFQPQQQQPPQQVSSGLPSSMQNGARNSTSPVPQARRFGAVNAINGQREPAKAAPSERVAAPTRQPDRERVGGGKQRDVSNPFQRSLPSQLQPQSQSQPQSQPQAQAQPPARCLQKSPAMPPQPSAGGYAGRGVVQNSPFRGMASGQPQPPFRPQGSPKPPPSAKFGQQPSAHPQCPPPFHQQPSQRQAPPPSQQHGKESLIAAQRPQAAPGSGDCPSAAFKASLKTFEAQRAPPQPKVAPPPLVEEDDPPPPPPEFD